MKILVVGAGYVGLVTGTCFAEMGHHVICLDIDRKKIDLLNKGDVPIYEPGLKELIARNVTAKRLEFTTDYKFGVKESKVVFIAVATPSREDGSCNTSYIEAAATSIAKEMDSYRLIVNKSTAPVGTASLIKEVIKKNTDQIFDVASNPEFLKEGSAINDCMKPDRIVVGVENSRAEELLKEIYAPFMFNHDKIIAMDIASAELTKYAANAMLATRISFMNELASISKKVGANINLIRKGIGSDARIGYSFLYAGVGYGGSCFPKDLRALISLAKQNDIEPKILESVEEVNNNQKRLLGELVEKYFSERGGLKGRTIAIWGLAFKPDTDDIREAPSLALIETLQKKGAHLRLYDPVAMQNVQNEIADHKNISFCSDEFDAAKGADAICLLTEWKQFRLIDFSSLAKEMQNRALFDGRNQYKESELQSEGFDYIGVGKPEKTQ